MTGMDELLAFLRAQLDEDERVARATPAQQWDHVDNVQTRRTGGCECDCGFAPGDVYEVHWHSLRLGPGRHGPRSLDANPTPDYITVAQLMPDEAEHIARWDPARVLALTAALRLIIDAFSWEAQETRAICILAEALYAGRPGYQDSWRP